MKENIIRFIELQEGELYKTFFSGQGWFHFRYKHGTWLGMNEQKFISSKQHENFTPSNGFKTFYMLDGAEIDFFLRCEIAGAFLTNT